MTDTDYQHTLLPDNSYLLRYILYGFRNKFQQHADDYQYFPSRPIAAPVPAFHFVDERNPSFFSKADLSSVRHTGHASFEELLTASGTTALLVIKGDRLLYEGYFNGGSRESLNSLYSITKSVLSALAGIALQEKSIKSIDDPVSAYIPERERKGFAPLTIKNLLRMDSGVRFTEGYLPWKDEVRTYFSPDSRALALRAKLQNPIGGFFHYNDYHPLLLGLVLERALQRPVLDYFREKLWDRLGAEFPALMKIDSKKHGFPKWESGLCASAIDIAKFGRLFLHNGTLNGKSIIPPAWIEESTGMKDAALQKKHYAYYDNHPWGRACFSRGDAYYKYFWWGYRIDETQHDYFAMGILGQVLYLSPRKDAIVLRLGKRWGVRAWWPAILREITEHL